MTLSTFTVNESQQFALIRGRADAPLLLLVQAGPGFPMIHEADALETRLHLEAEFRVIYWDQRGTGRSTGSSQPITLDLLVSDVSAMVDALCARFNVTAVDVAGFSLGGSLAILASVGQPRIRRVVAAGPDIDLPESERFAWQFARDQAIRFGHRRALKELDAIGHPPHDTPARFMTRVKWVTNFGGIEAGTTFLRLFLSLLFRLLRSPHYSLRQVVRALRAMQATQAQVLGSLGQFSLPARLKTLGVPLTVIQGSLDAAAPPELAKAFVEALSSTAPKALVVFTASAHSPHFEEPQRFRAVLLEALST